MAKIHEEVLIVKLSKLVKNDQSVDSGSIVSADVVTALEQVVQELVGESVIVDVELA